jgi:hypothetical protein
MEGLKWDKTAFGEPDSEAAFDERLRAVGGRSTFVRLVTP